MPSWLEEALQKDCRDAYGDAFEISGGRPDRQGHGGGIQVMFVNLPHVEKPQARRCR